MIVIIDYGLGNLKSVEGAIQKVGYEAVISDKVEDFEQADKLILPGVGAFGDGMANLHRLGFVEPLTDLVVQQGKPILGICLGAQLIAKDSCEFGHHEGLGWIDANVIKLEPVDKLRLPHVGWNELHQIRKTILFDDIPSEALFYYVHSFYIKCNQSDIVTGESEYGMSFTSVFQHENIYGTQFHPEKSQFHGLTLLKNFLDKA
jgi:glutamine amidotransferase